jgi:hypothetical protein
LQQVAYVDAAIYDVDHRAIALFRALDYLFFRPFPVEM